MSALPPTTPESLPGETTPAKQPAGLQLLFFTEMWERFSYYGMRALLVLYLVNAVGIQRADALQIYAVYTALVWLSPLLGGIIADRYLGYRKSILIGGIVMAAGHFAMAFPLVYGIIAAWPLVAPLWSAIPVWLRIGVPLAVTIGFMINVRATSSASDWQQVYVVIICSIFAIAFWMAFEQAGGTMNLFADKQVDRHLFGWLIPASIFQSINSLWIFTMAPLVAMMWLSLDRSRFAISAPVKMGLGLVIAGLSFVVLAYAQSLAEQFGTVSPLWLFGVYWLQTIGELLLSPVGLSMVTKLSPARFTGLLMGVWYCAIAIGSYLAGSLEGMLTSSGTSVFVFLIGSSVLAGALLILVTPLLKKWMHGHA